MPLVLAIVVLSAAEAVGCPTCKDALAEGDDVAANLARGYFYSILLMLGMPVTLAGSFGLYVWRELRRARQHAESQGAMAATVGQADGVRDGLP